MLEKQCTKCKELLPLSAFSKDQTKADGLQSWCKLCQNERRRDFSYKGQAARMYRHQQGNSKQRGHRPPTYSCEEFVSWCLSNPDYIRLHNAWKATGYPVQLTPSADRLDDTKGYSLDNIQLLTWEDNRLKGTHGRCNGPKDPTVLQYTKFGEYIAAYDNAAQAAQALGKATGRANIVHACAGRVKSAYGYHWKYAV